jgi:hypothetical protein
MSAANLPTRAHARKVLEIVDCGLTSGRGVPEPGKMCVEAAVCFALGEPHGDRPTCVGDAVRAFKIALNDAAWSSGAARARGMREIAIAQLGSNEIDQVEFAQRIAIAMVKHMLSRLLRRIGLVKEAEVCAAVETLDAAGSAAYSAASAASYAASAAYSAASAASYAASSAAYSAANFAADAASYAASAASSAAERDKVLTFAARLGTQVLLDMHCPGTEWLDLLDAPTSEEDGA